MNKNKIDFATNDKILYQVICEASPQERQYLSSIISSKVSSNIQASEVDPIAITSEIQLMGGDTFFNKLRGHGVPYSEVAYDAAECLGIKVKGLSIDLLEEKIVSLDYLSDG